MHDTPGLLTSTLIGTNLAIHIVTSTVTYIILRETGTSQHAEIWATVITTAPLFIFSELIPKNLFFYYSDILMLRISPLLYGFYMILKWCGVIAVFKYISWILAKLTNTPIPSKRTIDMVQRHETDAFFKDIHEENFLSVVQTDIVNRLFVVSNTTVQNVMTPLKKLQLLSVDSNRQMVLEIIRKHNYTRLPIYEKTHENIIGFINVYEVLYAKDDFDNLNDFIKPINNIPQKTMVTNAIEIMQSQKDKIVLVVKSVHNKPDKPIGIITMKDLAEELFGELGSW